MYGLFLLLIILAVVFASYQKSFVNYYPHYKLASRSWYDLLLWEAIYLPGFFELEIFLRGWWLVALRNSLGAAAIFSMTVPYCMMHFGKPYLETMETAMGAIALGSSQHKDQKCLSRNTTTHFFGALHGLIGTLAKRCLSY